MDFFKKKRGFRMRLQGKNIVLTGGAGGIGRVIARRILEEGGTLVLTGRTLSKLEDACAELIMLNAEWADHVHAVAMDGSNPASLAIGAAEIQNKLGSVSVLINNAGSAGPKQELTQIPLTKEDLATAQATGSPDTESLADSIGSLLGGAWFTTQALLPLFEENASIVNVSTVFSRTEYYGRIAYVMPKAGLNALSRIFAKELGSDVRGIRVNTVYPGPVESERIHSVFAAMDRLKRAPDGTTADAITSRMLLRHTPTGSPYVSKEEVAETILFLSSNESTGFTGHDFEVTHGLEKPKDSATQVISRPNLRVVDLEGRLVWIIAGNQVDEALALATRHHDLGAELLVTFQDEESLELAQARFGNVSGYSFMLLDPLNATHWHRLETMLYLRHQLPRATLVLPAQGPGHYGKSAIEAASAQVQEFFDRELLGTVAIAERLDQLLGAADKRLEHDPVVVFFGNGSDGGENPFTHVRREAITELIRVWRHENELMVQAGRRHRHLRINQLVRFENEEAINLDLACEWAASLSNGLRKVHAIDMVLAPKLAGSVQSRIALDWERQALRGLHLRKVALITGGSEGIGGEAARLLAISGARVAIAARDKNKLEKARANIIEELKLAGYSDPEHRVLIIPNCDVGDPDALASMVEQTLARFGRIDYLLNNAGISGSEQMVVDLPVEGWERTLMANLISNYDLITRVLPQMKRQGSGHILNVSSHFGGVRHATVAYPNRADYAVSKAGQRALAEVLAPLLGPDVQINAVAPGPVDGVRLRGSGGRPGLYARRAKLILENKRLNLVYAALVRAHRLGHDVTSLLDTLASNRMDALSHLEEKLLEGGGQGASASEYLLTKALAEKLIARLKKAALIPHGFDEKSFFTRFADAPEPFTAQSQIDRDAERIKKDVLGTLALGRMPSEVDVGREMVFYLSNRNVTGETLHPSGGLMLERLVMSGDFVGRIHPDLVSELIGQSVILVGDAMPLLMVRMAEGFLNAGAARTVIAVRSGVMLARIEAALSEKVRTDPRLELILRDDGDTVAAIGSQDIVVSLPLGELLPGKKKDELPVMEEFRLMVDEHLTHHMRVVQRASLIDGCRVILVTASSTHPMASFVRTTLRPLTVTAGQEGSRLVHQPLINQIDVASAGSDQKFLDALLLMAIGPARQQNAPHASRYTGATITV